MINDIKSSKIKIFTDLIVWQEGHKLVLKIYELTDEFPQKEKFGLSNQMQRAAVSITSNIAEGFSRKGYREKIQFFYTSLGSVTELQNQLIVAKDLKYISLKDYNIVSEQLIIVQKLLNGFIKKTKTILNS
jgi:four helix bundle protein